MNGLEAIKAMMEGRLVARWIYFGGGRVIYKIIDGNVFSKCSDHDESEYSVEDDFDFAEEYHEYKDPELFKGWERVNKQERYYSIGAFGGGCWQEDRDTHDDMLRYKNADYFSRKEKAEEICFKQTLFRKLQRFSDENGWNENDWTHEGRWEYCIKYDYDYGDLYIDNYLTTRAFGQVYFASHKVAEQALETFKEDLIKYFTHDWSKGE